MPFDAVEAVRPASQALVVDPAATLPWVRLVGEGLEWEPRHDLLASDAFAPDFVYEMEDDGRGRVRFGDDIHGRRPTELEVFQVSYRIGTGPAGNVGHDTLVRALGVPADIMVRNPMPAVGGRAPEATEHARLHAPQAFRRQERAVTEADYAMVAERHPEVQRAAATRRWTGSWHTMYLTVDRRGGLDVDPPFEARLRDHLDRFRMAGYDLEIDGPRWVPLDLELRICVAPGYIRSDVEQTVRAELSVRELPNGRRGGFHPDHLTFGQPVYLAPIVARAMDVAGVLSVEAVRFQRWREPAAGELDLGQLATDRLEIARLDDDPSRPEFGHLTLQMEGGS
jgi:predicted phage baseplate assembly protein